MKSVFIDELKQSNLNSNDIIEELINRTEQCIDINDFKDNVLFLYFEITNVSQDIHTFQNINIDSAKVNIKKYDNFCWIDDGKIL